MMASTIDDFYAMILAIAMIAVELMSIIVGAPIFGAMPVLIVMDGAIQLIPFMTAVSAVLILFVMNLWFARGFMNVIRNLQAAKQLREEYEEIAPVEST